MEQEEAAFPALYENARRALAELHHVDEVKDIRDKAVAMQEYFKQAKDPTLIAMATEVRLRAERRAGELLAEMEKNKGTAGHGRPSLGGTAKEPPKDAPPKLADLGVSKKQSSAWQRLAALSEAEFEGQVTSAKAKVEVAMSPKPKNQQQRGKRGQGPSPQLDKARQIVREKLDADESISPHKLQDEHGISHVTFDMAITAEVARKETLADPEIERAALSLTAQQKFDAAIRQEKRRLQESFDRAVQAEVQRQIEDWLPGWNARLKEADDLIRRRKGVMPGALFRQILSCLHPDRVDSELKERYTAAFNAFNELKLKLVAEEDEPAPAGPPIPRNWQEWEAAQAQAQAKRSAAAKARKREVA